LSLAISIICFISSALGAALVEEVVVVVGVDAVVVVMAGLLTAAGLAFGEVSGPCAVAMEAAAKRTLRDCRTVLRIFMRQV
jgi:hypothetical protein